MRNSRRSFLATASMAAAGNALGFRPFGMLNALAQTTSDYKALVCIFLFGGNDANNMLIPFDTTGYQNYSSIRGPLALPQTSLLQLAKQPNFALHPSLPEVQSLFNSGNAAILANVGTLLSPTTKAQYQAGQVLQPTNLFSHPDQQLEWQNQMQSTTGATGWAGRIADKMHTQYNPGALVPMIASLSGDALFCNGTSTSPVSIGATGPVAAVCSVQPYCNSRQQTAQQFSTLSSGVSLVQADNSITNNAYTYNATLTSALGSSRRSRPSFQRRSILLAHSCRKSQNSSRCGRPWVSHGRSFSWAPAISTLMAASWLSRQLCSRNSVRLWELSTRRWKR